MPRAKVIAKLAQRTDFPNEFISTASMAIKFKK
jgi:hypothetical protein